jgi:hypothetical protein
MSGRSSPIDYRGFAEQCPTAVRACKEEAIWLMHYLFLGDRDNVDMLMEAIHKTRKLRGEIRR